MVAPEQSNKGPRRWLHAFLGVATCSWFVFVFRRYAPDLNADALRQIAVPWIRLALRWGLPDILLIVGLCVAACAIGKNFLRRMNIFPDPGMEDIRVSVVVGMALISWAVALLAALHLLYAFVAYALLAAPLLVWRRDLREMVAALGPPRAHPNGNGSLLATRIVLFFFIVYALGILFILFVSSLGPEIEYDPLAMHLKAARTFVQEHRLTSLPDIPQTFFPRNITMLYTLGMLLRGETTVKLINFLLGLLTLWVTYSFARRLLSREAGLAAAAILLASPLFVWEMRTAHLDLGFALYVCLSLYTTLEWLEKKDKGWFRLAVLSTAFSLGTKYQALFSLGSLSLLILVYRLIESRRLRKAVPEAVRFFSLSLLGMLPWGVANLIQTGNPVFPFFNGLFHSPFWSPGQMETVMVQMREAGVPITPENWWSVLTVFWQMTVEQTGKFHGNIGPFYLLLLPLLAFRRPIPTPGKLILGFSFFYGLFWLLTGQHLRYFLGALPGLAVVAAVATVGWLEAMWRARQQVVAVAVAVLLGSIGVFSTPYFENYGSSARYGFTILDTLPWKYLAGAESRDDYLTRHVKDYPLIQRLNRLPGPQKVLFWWTDPQPAAFHLNGQAAFSYSPFFHQLFTEDASQIHTVLRANGVTHVIVGQASQENDLLGHPERPFVQGYLKKIDQRNTMILYEVLPRPVQQEVIFYDFLTHLGEAQFNMPMPLGKQNHDYWTVREVGGDWRRSLATFPPAEVRYAITLPERPVLRFAVGRVFPPCDSSGSFQIRVESPDGERHEVYRRDLRAGNPLHPVGWYDEAVDLARFRNQQVQVIFKSEYTGPGGCNWFLWADPVLILLPESSKTEP